MRPIMMTTIAMIAGMLPIAMGIGAGSEVRSSMAVAVIGGLITSTFLTLLVVPVVYTFVDDFATFTRRKRVELWGAPRAETAALASEVPGTASQGGGHA